MSGIVLLTGNPAAASSDLRPIPFGVPARPRGEERVDGTRHGGIDPVLPGETDEGPMEGRELHRFAVEQIGTTTMRAAR